MGDKLRFHIFGMAHIPTLKEISPCAYTQKIYNLCKMIKREKNTELFFYGVEGSKVDCDENVNVVSAKTWKEQFGNYNFWATQFDTGEGKGPCWEAMRTNAVPQVQKRLKDHDFILMPQGHWHRAIPDRLKGKFAVVESGIGYRGIYARFKVFESYAWMHYMYGVTNVNDGHTFDTVIPNYYDKNDFKLHPSKKSDYVLFIGRLVKRKGLDTAVAVAREAGRKLLVAGQVTPETKAEWIKGKGIEYLGVLNHKERNKVMSKAHCVLVPTIYIEPFGGVSVEAQMCATPVCSSDFGSFPEIVLQGVTGYRCVTLGEWVNAIENCGKLDPQRCRRWAMENFELDVIGPRYMHYFRRIMDLWTPEGVNSKRKQNLQPREIHLP